MKSSNIHILVISTGVLVSVVLCFNLRTRSAAREAQSRKLVSELELAHSTAVSEALKTKQLEALMNESVNQINARLTEMSAEKEMLVAQSTNVAPMIEAELPYCWDDDSPTARVGKRFLKSIGVQPLAETADGDYHVDAVMAAALSMAPGEITSVNESLQNMTRDFRELEKQALEISDEVDEPTLAWMQNMNPTLLMVFHVPAIPEAGSALQNRFVSDLSKALGPSRTEMFMELGEDQFKALFGSFGQADQWLCVAERIEPTLNDLALNVVAKTSDGYYYNTNMGIPRSLIGKSGNAIPTSWKHLIEGHYVQGQSLRASSPTE